MAERPSIPFTLPSTINPPVLMRGITGVVKDGLDKK